PELQGEPSLGRGSEVEVRAGGDPGLPGGFYQLGCPREACRIRGGADAQREGAGEVRPDLQRSLSLWSRQLLRDPGLAAASLSRQVRRGADPPEPSPRLRPALQGPWRRVESGKPAAAAISDHGR